MFRFSEKVPEKSGTYLFWFIPKGDMQNGSWHIGFYNATSSTWYVDLVREVGNHEITFWENLPGNPHA